MKTAAPLAVLLALGPMACRTPEHDRDKDAAPAAIAEVAPSAPERPLRRKPKNELELPTTAPTEYFANLDAQIETIGRLAQQQSGQTPSRWRLLAGLHRVRAIHRGDFDELATTIDQIGRAIALDATDAEAYVERADALVAMHRYKDARADLDQAAQLGGDGDAALGARAEIDWLQGKYEGAREAVEAAARQRPSLRALARVAMIRHELGDFDGAERAFEAAEDLATEASPVPIAWLYALRARHLLAFGRVDEALAFVRDSVRRVPFEADALATYADALRAAGNEDEALSIYQEAIKHTSDPRVWGELSRMVRARGKDHEADTLKWRAMWRYGEMLARHPEASYASAARFYLETAGDAARALELYRKDLALGASSDRIVAVANALLATGRAPAACEAIEKALAMPVKSARLYWTAARAYALTGDAAKARDFAARARALNAKIDKLEPPMVAENAVAPAKSP